MIAVALLIGVAAFPGAFIESEVPLSAHTAILDAVVVTGGALMIAGALGVMQVSPTPR